MASIHVKPDGAFMVRWRVDGKLRGKQFKTRADAEAFKRSMDDPAPTQVPEGWQLQRYLQGVIDRDHSLRPTTRETYARTIHNHIAGTALAEADVRHVGVDQLREFWDTLPQDRPGVVRSARMLVSKAFNAAYREGVIDANPLARAGLKAPPKQRQVEVVPLSVEEVEGLANATVSQRDKAAILLMAYGGLRAGEVGGLRDADVDWDAGRLHLRQQAIDSRSGKSIAPLKTRAARRTVSIPASVVVELRALRPAADGRLFPGDDGGLWAHQGITNATQRAAKRAGMRRVHAHLLRHSAVSLLIDGGANARAVQVFIGHSSVTMTLGTYGHLFDSGGDALALSMEARRVEHRARNDP